MESSVKETQNVRKDLKNIVFLMFLYMLQMIPIGLTGSLPYILSSKNISYAEQGFFSLAFWPFSLKLLWAPIVDAIYSKKLGRRKSWLIPLQLLIGLYMISFSGYVRSLFDNNRADVGIESNIRILTGIFFVFTFLAATHDICVDGWALTMLSKENVSLSSTCESVGGTAGWFIGNVMFLVVESAEFSNKYIRQYAGLEDQAYGIVTIDKFMYFFGMVFIATASFVILFKKENKTDDNQEQSADSSEDLSVLETYKIAWKIICLKPIHKVIFCMFTLRICTATESMAFMKIVEAGVPKEKLGLLAVPLSPLNLLLPFAISRVLNGISPFKYIKLTIALRTLVTLVMASWVYVTPFFKDQETGQFSNRYFLIMLGIQSLHSVVLYASFIPMMFFFSQISDKNFGGTYMTFLNTIANLSRNWINTGALYLANFLSVKVCDELNENCETTFDPYFMLTGFCVMFGFVWVVFISKTLVEVEQLPKKEWEIYQDKFKLRTE